MTKSESTNDEQVKPLTFNRLREANAARAKLWNQGQSAGLAFAAMELAGECGEACNLAKKLERLRMGWPGGRDTRAELADELADVIICADLMALELGIDLELAILAKFNRDSARHDFPVKLGAPT